MSNLYDTAMKHNGYYGSVQYYSKGKSYYGRILNTGYLVNYEANTLEELVRAFKKATEELTSE